MSMTDREPQALDVLDDAGRKVLFTEARTANTTRHCRPVFLLAVRASGFAAGPMAGFDKAGVDEEFFAGTGWRSHLVVNIGHPGAELRVSAAAPRARRARPRLGLTDGTPHCISTGVVRFTRWGVPVHRMEPWGLAAKATSLALGDAEQSRPSPHAVANRAPRTAPVTGAPVVLADCSGPKEKTRE